MRSLVFAGAGWETLIYCATTLARVHLNNSRNTVEIWNIASHTIYLLLTKLFGELYLNINNYPVEHIQLYPVDPGKYLAGGREGWQWQRQHKTVQQLIVHCGSRVRRLVEVRGYRGGAGCAGWYVVTRKLKKKYVCDHLRNTSQYQNQFI